MTAAPHLGFIVAAYALAGITILTMIVLILWDYRTLTADLNALKNSRRDKREDS